MQQWFYYNQRTKRLTKIIKERTLITKAIKFRKPQFLLYLCITEIISLLFLKYDS